MHYRNGREAKNGDKVIQLGCDSAKVVSFGVLHDAEPGNDYCNGLIASTSPSVTGACMCDCLHVDDLAAVLVVAGLGSRPEVQQNKTSAHPNIVALAGHMYSAYCNAVGGKAFNGDPLPDWATFSSDPTKAKQSDGWIAAANAARNWLQGPQ